MNLKTCWMVLLVVIEVTNGVFIERSAYKDVVIEIRDNVPVEECSSILADLEVCLKILCIFLLYWLSKHYA